MNIKELMNIEELKNFEPERKILSTEISVQDFIEHCVDVPRFRECCEVCPNFGKTWSCPPYDFDPLDYWKQYQTFFLYAIKTTTPKELLEKTYELDDLMRIGGAITFTAVKVMDDFLEKEHQKHPGSQIIGGGKCLLCGENNCARQNNEPCRFPDQLVYSIESLGGNVQETLKRYLNEDIYWGEAGHLAPYYIRIGGLLRKD